MSKFIAVLVVVLAAVGLGACSKSPLEQAKALAVSANEERKAVDVRDAAGPQEIRCDSGTPDLVFFDSTSGDSLIYYLKIRGHVTCFDRPGYDRKTGLPLQPMSRPIVDDILKQPCPPAPPTPPAPAPAAPAAPKAPPQLGQGKISDLPSTPTAPATAPTPLPQLGEGPCCGG